MRKIRFGALAVACLLAAGCPSACDAAKLLSPSGVQSVTVAPAAAQVTVGQTQQFAAIVRPDSASEKGVAWTVTPSTLATIDAKGLLTALAPGQAVVTATTVATPVHSAEASATISVPVNQLR